jgi:hypothetical protein
MTKHPAFKCHTLQKRAVLNVLRQRLNVLRNFIINTLEVLRHTLILQSVARKAVTTQWYGGGRNTATLLSLKYLYIYICTYMHVRIGVSKERRSKCCAPRQAVSA